MRRRRGFVLVTVIIVAAILLAAAFVFGSQTATEQYVGRTNTLFKSALSLAETGVAQVFEDTRVARPSQSLGGTYFTIEKLKEVAGTPGTVTLSEQRYQSMTGTGASRDVGTYRVSVTRLLPTTPVNLNDTTWTFDIRIRSEGQVYPPGTNLVSVPSGTNSMARRVVEVQAHVVVNATGGGVNALKYAILAGSSISLKGNAVVQNGDMRSNDSIKVSNGAVFAGGAPPAGPLALSTSVDPDAAWAMQNYERFVYPTIDLKTYRRLADSLLVPAPDDGSFPMILAAAPYDGSDPAFGAAVVYATDPLDYLTALTTALSNLRTEYYKNVPKTVTYPDGSTQKYYYVSDVAPIKAFVAALIPWETNPLYPEINARVKWLLRTAVYYVESSHTVSMDGTQMAGHDGISRDLSHGSIVINGDVKIVSQSWVGNDEHKDESSTEENEGYLSSLYVTGNIDVQGGAYLRGLFHSDGEVKATGGMDLLGSLQAKTFVTVGGSSGSGNGPQYKIVYDPRIGGTKNVYLENPTPTAVAQQPGTWVEISNFP